MRYKEYTHARVMHNRSGEQACQHSLSSAYTKYRMGIRNDFNVLFMGCRLFQQWIVNSLIKIEKGRIFYCKSTQTDLRAE